jgi:tetratricopeptide (TPR) repeat protein
MYPHLTPYGIIMKINRQPLLELTEDMVKRDHEFWKQFSKRLTGDIVDYDTPVKTIAQWVEKTYLRRDFSGFTGDRAFVRDDSAQKAFSKLRSSIGGIYNWRVMTSAPGTPNRQRMIKEADFAFRQAFAFCPYSPEAVFRYVQLLTIPELQRYEDALLVAKTGLKLDPYNGALINLVRQLGDWKKDHAAAANVLQMEQEVEKNPANFQMVFNLASTYLQMQQTDRALWLLDRVLTDPRADAAALRGVMEAYATFNRPKLQASVATLEARVGAPPTNLQVAIGLAEGYRQLQQLDKATQTLDQVLNNPQADANALLQVAQSYAQLSNLPKLEASLDKLVKTSPDSPEAWYDLAALKVTLAKPPEALTALSNALALSQKRHQQDPSKRDLMVEVQKDNRFDSIRKNPEFQKLLVLK